MQQRVPAYIKTQMKNSQMAESGFTLDQIMRWDEAVLILSYING